MGVQLIAKRLHLHQSDHCEAKKIKYLPSYGAHLASNVICKYNLFLAAHLHVVTPGALSCGVERTLTSLRSCARSL